MLKIKAVGHESGKYVQLEDNRWVEINPTTGDILREIPKRRFVEHDDQGNIVAVHDIEFSLLLEETKDHTKLFSRAAILIDDPTMKKKKADEILSGYRVKRGKLEPKTTP